MEIEYRTILKNLYGPFIKGSMFDFPKTVSAEIQDFAENAEKYRNQKCPAKSKPSIDLGWAEAEVDLKLPIKDRLKRFRIQENVMQVESEGTAQSLEREMKSIEEKGKGKPSNKTIQTKQDSESQTQNSRVFDTLIVLIPSPTT